MRKQPKKLFIPVLFGFESFCLWLRWCARSYTFVITINLINSLTYTIGSRTQCSPSSGPVNLILIYLLVSSACTWRCGSSYTYCSSFSISRSLDKMARAHFFLSRGACRSFAWIHDALSSVPLFVRLLHPPRTPQSSLTSRGMFGLWLDFQYRLHSWFR